MSQRKPIPKRIRELVYDKCSGHCAYCGCELEYKDMQVDHIDAVCRAELQGMEVNDSIDNYMPACRMCNYYKHINNIEEFRNNLKNMLMRNVQRPFDFRLAQKYGMVKVEEWDGKFYFEREKE